MNNDRRAEIMSALPALAQASALIVQARDIVDGAKDEEQSYFDEMPEGFKNGEKGSVAEATLSALEEAVDGIDTIDIDGVVRAVEEAAERSATVGEVLEMKLTPDDAEKRRRDRLPAWAKEEIARLQAQAEAADARAAASLKDYEEGSNRGVVNDFMGALNGKEVPCERVKFPQVGVTVYLEHGHLCAHSDEGGVHIRPRAGNEVWIKADGRGE